MIIPEAPIIHPAAYFRARVLAEEIVCFGVPSEAKNLSSIQTQEKKDSSERRAKNA
jgi:hypothetical protein